MGDNMWIKSICDMEKIVFRGRQKEIDGGRMLLWPLSGVDIRIRCRELYVEAEGRGDGHAPWLCVWADGGVIARFPVQKGRYWYPAMLGMDDQVEHTVTVVCDTQPVGGDGMRLLLHSLKSDGQVLDVPAPKYQIEFIGDSLTTGEGCTGPCSAREWKTAWMSPSFGYAHQVGCDLSARVHLISQSGWGVCSDWEGKAQNNLPRIYETLCDLVPEANEPYAFDTAMDAVVLNLGTNDHSAVARLPEDERDAHRQKIRQGAADFIRMIRKHHPRAYILWTYGMCGGDLGKDLAKAVETVRSEGDLRVGYAQLPACAEEDTGSLLHPGVKNHDQAAQVILAHLKSVLD
ncbi:MAG: hypothetical protein E7326_08865 [Clostridiales bacterium]|nr:hypothetical protein [Clostridiales bacterium]